MKRIVLLRHGQSQWNLENRFTGWTDVELTDKGREEARNAGKKLREAGIMPQFFFTSYLKRAIHTLQIAADELDLAWVPVIKDWHLNERHYGVLQDTMERVNPCWEERITPKLHLYNTVLVAAHGNSLRALAMMLLHLTPDEIMKVEIPTGAPWIFELDDRFSVLKEYYI